MTTISVAGPTRTADELLPVLAVGRIGLSERTAELLRHAAPAPSPRSWSSACWAGAARCGRTRRCSPPSSWRRPGVARLLDGRVVVLGGCAYAVVAGAVALLG